MVTESHQKLQALFPSGTKYVLCPLLMIVLVRGTQRKEAHLLKCVNNEQILTFL
jgi:hypothetical protein